MEIHHGHPWMRLEFQGESGNHSISIGYQWTSMDVHGCPWKYCDIHGRPRMPSYLQISMEVISYPWVYNYAYGYPPEGHPGYPCAVLGSTQIAVDTLGQPRRAPYINPWISLGIHGCPCVAIHG